MNRTHKKLNTNTQSGITLLLAILILAAITAIAFSLAAIVLVEIRSSGDVTRTEPALYAAQAITEESFFKYQRSVSDDALNLSAVTFNGVTLTSVIKKYDDAPRVDTIPANTTVNYLFIDPDNPSDFSTKVYDSVTTSVLNGVTNATGTFTKCCDASGSSVPAAPGTVTLSPSDTFGITDTKQYNLAITNNSQTIPLLIQIDPVKVVAVNGKTHLIPLLGKALDITASYLGLTRKYSVSIAQISTPTFIGQAETVWVEDSVPAGATQTGDEAWNWIGSNPNPFSGGLASQSNIVAGEHQHYFYGANSLLLINSGETLLAYIYLDPANVPTEVMLQWNNGSWEHRAYWGANQIGWGTDNTDSRRFMGALPVTGQWVRLAVPASQVGLEGSSLNGLAFTLYGGRATWDHAGKQ